MHHQSTFILYRVLGNDLPPRHRVGQTLDNLRFVLEHEPQLTNCEKRWVLNRIVDPVAEDAALRLIKDAGHAVLRIPFSLDEYAKLPFASEVLEEHEHLHTKQFLELPVIEQAFLVERCLRKRNRYVTNQNGARNLALREGRAIARWVLPWDGNVFLTTGGWEAIRAEAEEAEAADARYLIVPMARVLGCGLNWSNR